MTYQHQVNILQDEIDIIAKNMLDNMYCSANYLLKENDKINALQALQNHYLSMLNPNYIYGTPIELHNSLRFADNHRNHKTKLIYHMAVLNEQIRDKEKETPPYLKSYFRPETELSIKLDALNNMLDENRYIKAQDLLMSTMNKRIKG